MASISLRSSRRSEGLTTRSSAKNNVALGNPHNRHQQSNIGRKKRPRDSLDDEKHLINTKKAKLAVEITVLPKSQPETRSVVIQSDTNDVPPKRSAAAEPPATVKTTTTQTTTESPPRKPTIHHEKVANGIKHELDRLQDRLQPKVPDPKDEKRKLRSQEGTRFKSELSLYFPEYDEIIGNEPKEERMLLSLKAIEFIADLILDILNFETPIIIVDSAKAKPPPSTRKTHEYPIKEFPSSLFDNLHNAERVDFTFLSTQFKNGDDPLSDEYFELIHRRPERAEKGVRNSDKGRAQHEKDQVIRLLEGLQGPDWLKLMGVSGITDGRKKEFEPARHHFIKGCRAIIEKFRIWREEEKRRKLEKEQAMAEAEEEAEGDEEVEEDMEEEVEEEQEPEEVDGYASDGDPPDYSDVDASAARQLHEEAIARSAPLQASRRGEKRVKVEMVPPAPVLEKDFISFFSKPHLREAALGRSRRSGRSEIGRASCRERVFLSV